MRILGKKIKQVVKIYPHLERILLDIITCRGYHPLDERNMIDPIGKAFA